MIHDGITITTTDSGAVMLFLRGAFLGGEPSEAEAIAAINRGDYTTVQIALEKIDRKRAIAAANRKGTK